MTNKCNITNCKRLVEWVFIDSNLADSSDAFDSILCQVGHVGVTSTENLSYWFSSVLTISNLTLQGFFQKAECLAPILTGIEVRERVWLPPVG
jgi:hypothetical protein